MSVTEDWSPQAPQQCPNLLLQYEPYCRVWHDVGQTAPLTALFFRRPERLTPTAAPSTHPPVWSVAHWLPPSPCTYTLASIATCRHHPTRCPAAWLASFGHSISWLQLETMTMWPANSGVCMCVCVCARRWMWWASATTYWQCPCSAWPSTGLPSSRATPWPPPSQPSWLIAACACRPTLLSSSWTG